LKMCKYYNLATNKNQNFNQWKKIASIHLPLIAFVFLPS
jgi:hypothetical protein